MNKAGLVEEVAGKMGLTKKDVGLVIDGFIGTMNDALSNGERLL